VLVDLSWVKGLVGKEKNVRVELFLAHKKLSEVDGSCDRQRVCLVDPHAVEVPKAVDAHEVLVLGRVGEEAHALEVAVLEEAVDGQHQLVLEELVEDGAQQVHARVLPEAALVVEDLVAHDVGDGGQFVVGAALVEVDEGPDQLVGHGEGFPRDVLLPPQLDLVRRVQLLGLLVAVLFGGRQVAGPQPHLMDDLRNEVRPPALVD
jgi:hypothetical protein